MDKILTLLIEDNDAHIFLLNQTLKEADEKDYQIFNNVPDFLSALQKSICVIVLDHYLGAWTGLDLLETIFEHNKLSKVIIVSGQKNFNILYQYVRSGVVDYIDKNDKEYLSLLVASIKKQRGLVLDYFELSTL